jgi:hypothetical protein
VVLLNELPDDRRGRPQETFNFNTRAVCRTKPDNFWRSAYNYASFLEVGILRDNREAIVFGVLPNNQVVGAAQTAIVNMSGARISICQDFRQSGRNIFVEEELHAFGISSLRSRSAA